MEKKLLHFKRWVFWSGVITSVLYLPWTCPFTFRPYQNITNNMAKSLGLSGPEYVFPMNLNNLYLIYGLGIILVFWGIFLILASFDIKNRAWLVFWMGLCNFVLVLYGIYFVLALGSNQIMIGFISIDLIFGLIYMYYIFTIEGLRKI
jgi:hypothetical protein